MTRLQQLLAIREATLAQRPGWDSQVKRVIFRAVYPKRNGVHPTRQWLDAEILRAEQAEAWGRPGPIQPGEIV